MENINFREIIETSSQKSLLTGNPGFGVRTYTQGMEKDEVDAIYHGVTANYELPIQRKVNMSTLRDNPEVVCSYPVVYRYKKVDAGNGRSVNTFTRTIYVGIDYGYFCNKESAMRAGDNYLSHILIPEQPFHAFMFSLFARQDAFSPVNRSCRPDNLEFQQLLTGEPVAMPPRTLLVNKPTQVDELTGKLAIVFLQARINNLLGEKATLSQVVIKSPEAEVAGLIARMATLPDKLVEPMTFQTNYMQGGGVPMGYNMVFVNEYNQEQIYEAGYVVFDVEQMSMGNVIPNYYFEQIVESAREGNHEMMTDLIEFLLNWKMTPNTDFLFAYKLFKITQTSLDITINDLTEDFFDKILVNDVCEESVLSVVKSKVTNVINGLLSTGNNNESQKNSALDICSFLSEKYPEMLDIDESAKQDLTDYIFGDRKKLSQLVNKYGAGFILSIIRKEVSLESFLEAMTCFSDKITWQQFLDFYFGETTRQNIDFIIDSIIKSQVPNKQELVLSVYPYAEFGQNLYDYILMHPEQYLVLSGIITTICRSVSDCNRFNEVLSKLMSKIGTWSDELISLFSDLVSGYYLENSKTGMVSAMEAMLRISQRQDIRKLHLNALVNAFCEYATENPSEVPSALITDLEENVEVEDCVMKKLRVIRSFIDDETESLKEITEFEISLAKRMKSKELIKKVFIRYLQAMPTDEKIKKVMKEGGAPSYELGRELIGSVWENLSIPQHERERIVLCLFESFAWTGTQRTQFFTDCQNQDLSIMIKKNFGFFKRVIHKIFKS